MNATRALPKACALGMSILGSPDTLLVPVNPKNRSDMNPTSGVANAATAPSKHLSNEYTRFLCDGGTISANIGLFAQGAAHAVSTAKREMTTAYKITTNTLEPSGNICTPCNLIYSAYLYVPRDYSYIYVW